MLGSIFKQILLSKYNTLLFAWFLKIVSVQTSVCVFACVSTPRLLKLVVQCGVIWKPNDWFNKFYSCYMATVVVMVNGHGLCIIETNPIRASQHCIRR